MLSAKRTPCRKSACSAGQHQEGGRYLRVAAVNERRRGRRLVAIVMENGRDRKRGGWTSVTGDKRER